MGGVQSAAGLAEKRQLMILAQRELRVAVKARRIVFDPPLEETQWGKASVDLRLGFEFTRFRRDIDHPKYTISVADGLEIVGKLGIHERVLIPAAGHRQQQDYYTLRPGDLVLAMTYESITVPRDMIARLEGRSTYARVGLSVHQTAPWAQPGWEGPLILEIFNSGPLTLALTPLVDRPCQLSFFRLSSKLPQRLAYGARSTDRYQHQKQAIPRGAGSRRR